MSEGGFFKDFSSGSFLFYGSFFLCFYVIPNLKKQKDKI